ncbi:SMC-Scp complex subunit ScpB [Bacillus sp. Brlt_9]|uniref:SMC-Scp complex subunit ScpB n=1 Tax=Bacillus sp. Brlt_9 TaxID=3110916 RepID=UPI003F7BAED1
MDKNAVEAILFITKEPITSEKISKLLNEQESTVDRWLSELERDYENRGIQIRRVAGGFEMVSTIKYHQYVEPLVAKEYEFLSKPTLETITLVATLQPVKKSTIAQYRGVQNPDNGIESALALKLISETSDGYITTDAFLKLFGINDLKELEEKLKEIDR